MYSQFFTGLNETPVYEFGFGLSYTNFSYSNIQVTANSSAPAYTPNTGSTTSAPIYGSISNSTSEYEFPTGFHQVLGYIYPYLNASTLSAASQDSSYGINYSFPSAAYDSSPQPVLRAGGAPGGNPRLYDILFTVTATVTNTGSVAGKEVPQLYISLGGPNDPKVALRQFDKFSIAPGASETFTAQLTRRDLSNWDSLAQDWFISTYTKTVYVGSSSRKLPLSAVLTVTGTDGAPTVPGSGGSGNATYTAPTLSSTSKSYGSTSHSSSHSSSFSTTHSSSHSSSNSTAIPTLSGGSYSTTW